MNKKPIPTLLILILSIGVCLTLLAGTAAADDWVGGLPLTNVQTGTVTGDLYISGNPPQSTAFDKVVDRTFTLPSAAVAESGRVKWARLYVSSYCGHMQDAKIITYTTKADWNNDGTWDNTWPETDNPGQPFIFMQGGDYGGGGNDNSEFAGHNAGEPYLMLNEHTTRVTSDYLSWYDVTNLIQPGNSTIKVNVDATGSYDGRIKVVELVVAYDDPSSTTETRYWVNEGHDSCSYYTEENEGTVAVGTTTFDTSGLSGIISATLIADYMASNNGYYGFPTNANNFYVDENTGKPFGNFTNIELDRDPDAQGQYSGIDTWNVTSSVINNNSVTLAYSRYLPASGLAQFYKIPLAFLVVKKPISTPAPIANFTANRTSGTAPLAVQFTDASTGTVSSYAWDFNNDGNVDSTAQSPSYTYSAPGTYTVNLTVTGPGGSDSEVKVGYITATAPATNDLSITGMVNTVPASAIFARETNTVTVASIKNTGPAQTNVSVAIYASDVSGGTVPVNTTTIASIANNGTAATVIIIDPTVRSLEGGTITYTAVVDPNNLIAETNEANNNKSSAAKPLRYNGYKGKGIYWAGESNITTKHTYDLKGNLLSSTQPDTAYKSVGWTTRTETWNASDLPVPSGSTIEKAYLYFAYNWDQTPGGYPWLNLNFNGNILDNGDLSTGNGTLYRDWSNFGAYADYEYGLCVYDVTDKFNPSGNTLDTNPYSSSYNQVALYPSTLVVIYRNSNETRKQIFINEGCDELGLSQASYGTTSEEATTYAPFTGVSIDVSNVTNATLYSYGGSIGPNEGNLLFNGNIVATNAWQGNSNTASPLVFNATNYITATENVFGMQSTTSGGMDPMQQILVLESPGETLPSAAVADFTANVTSGTAPLAVQFTDTSTGNVISRLWDFGDGNNNNSPNPSHTYNTSGTYNVSLTVTGPNGSDSEVKIGYIVVSGPSSAAPVANFTVTPTSGIKPLNVSFTDMSTGSPTSWIWDFGDSSPISNEQNPVHVYDNAGSYNVSLTVWNVNGQDTKTIEHYILVESDQSIKFVLKCPVDMEVVDPDGLMINKQTDEIPGAIYKEDDINNDGSPDDIVLIPVKKLGDYKAKVVPDPDVQITDTDTYTLEVYSSGNHKILAEDVLAKDNLQKEYVVPSEMSDSVPPYSILNLQSTAGITWINWTWTKPTDPDFNHTEIYFNGTFRNNTSAEFFNETDLKPDTSYTLGTRTVDNSGNMNQTWVNSTVKTSKESVSPVAGFSPSVKSGNAPLTVHFTDNSKYADKVDWDFNGDNVIDISDAPRNQDYTYTVPGTYTVNQTVSNVNGAKITATDKITVTASNTRLPKAAFNASPISGVAPLTVQFTDQSTNATLIKWDFGDKSGTSTRSRPSHTYTTAGTYTVTLTAYKGANSDVASKTINVTQPAALKINAINADIKSGNAPLTVKFSCDVSGKPTSCTWIINKQTIKRDASGKFKYTFTKAGVYDVTLVVKDAYRQSDSMTNKGFITVLPGVKPPVASFSAKPTYGKAPLTVQFTDRSKNNPTSWVWDFGDKTPVSIFQNTSHIYQNQGKYTVTLTVQNAGGKNSITIRKYIVVRKINGRF